jgi:diketogulonate reductase-like aldo/keto reductase
MSSSTNQTVPSLEMNDGHRIPQLGFGVFKVDPDRTADIVAHALQVGYRSIDTATLYDNEDGVGAAIAESGIAREKLFVTTKVWNDDQGHDATLRAFERSLRRLGLEYVDLYLIHWPVPAQDRYVETWQALTELKADGRARSIGVSNFQIEHLRRVIAETGVTPAVNQIELHPHLQQAQLRRFHDETGILTEAWSPLGRGRALDDSVVNDIARRHERTAAQVVLRWHLQLGNVVIPKSATPARVEENFAVFDFELSAAEMEAIAGLEAASRIGPDPDRFD